MQRDTSMDDARSKVYGTTRIYDSGGSVERAATIQEADDRLGAAQEAATHAVARAVEAAEDAKEAQQEADQQAAEEAKKAANKAKLDKKKAKATAKAAQAVQDAVDEVVGGDSVVDADTPVPTEDAPPTFVEGSDEPEKGEEVVASTDEAPAVVAVDKPAKKKAAKK